MPYPNPAASSVQMITARERRMIFWVWVMLFVMLIYYHPSRSASRRSSARGFCIRYCWCPAPRPSESTERNAHPCASAWRRCVSPVTFMVANFTDPCVLLRTLRCLHWNCFSLASRHRVLSVIPSTISPSPSTPKDSNSAVSRSGSGQGMLAYAKRLYTL